MGKGQLTERLNRDFVIYLTGRILPAGLSFVAVGLFIRLLGRAEYGKFALVQSIILLISAFGSSWLAQPTLRFNGNFKSISSQQRLNQVVKKGLRITNLLLLPLVAISFVIFTKIPFYVIIGILLAIFFQVIYSVYVTRQSSLLNPRLVLLGNALRMSGYLAFSLALYFVFPHLGYAALILGLVCGNLLGDLVVLRGVQVKRFARENQILVHFLRYGAPLALWAGIAFLLNVSDRYLIAWLLGVKSVGTYSAIYDVVSKLFGLFLTPVITAAHPIIMNAWNQKRGEEAYSAIWKSLKLQIVLALIAMLGLSIFSRQICFLILGRVDPQATSLVLPVALGTIVWQFAMLVHKPLEIKKRLRPMITWVTVALAVNVVCNIFLLPLYGYVAAAYTTILGALIYVAFISYETNFRTSSPIKA